MPLNKLMGRRAVFFNRISRRALLTVAALILITLALFVAPRLTGEGLEDELIATFSVLFICIAVLGRTWAILYIDGDKYYNLVTDGPYSLCRNPLYTFTFFGAAGAGAASGSIILAALTLLVTAVVFYALVLKEETILLERHGTAYADYCERVNRFLPTFSNWKSVEWVRIRPAAVVATFFEALLIALAYPAFFLIDWAQQAGWLPVLLKLY